MTNSNIKESKEDLEIIDLLNILFINRKIIIVGTAFSVFISILTSYILPEKFKSSTTIIPVSAEKSNNMPSQLNGLATLAGVNLSNSQAKKNEYVAILKSREFLYPFFEKHNVSTILFEDKWDENKKTWKIDEKVPTLWDTYKKFHDDIFTLSEEIATGLITVSIETKYPETSMIWTNALIEEVNTEIKNNVIEESEQNLAFLGQKSETVKISNIREAINRTIERELQRAMMANVSDEYAFKVIDKAVVAEIKSSPKRMIITITGFFLGFFFFVLVALIRTSIRKE